MGKTLIHRRSTANAFDTLEPRRLLSSSVESVLPLRVNAGGGYIIDSLARTFQPDSGFTGGTAQTDSGYDVAGTSDDGLFLSYHAGASFAFSAAVPDGHYSLWLEFAEPSATAVTGQRVFSVQSGTTSLLNNFDITQSAGATRTAIAKDFDITISGGSLDLNFSASAGQALIDAIALTPTDPPTEAAAYSWENLSDGERITLDESHLRIIGNVIELYANDHKGHFPPDLVTADQDFEGVRSDIYVSPRTDSAIPRGTMSPLERSAWVATRADYIYLGAGQSNTASPNTILAYDNPDRVAGDIDVLYGDGHVGSLDRADAAVLIGFADVPPNDPPPSPPTTPAPDPKVVQSASNLSAISADLLDYSNDNKGHLPTSFGELATDLHLPPSLFLNPRSTTTVPANNWTEQQKADWINANSDYVYLGAAKHEAQFGGEDAVAYEKSAGMTGGINLLFGDGHVEFREFRWADETLAPVTAPSIRDASLDPASAGQLSLRFLYTEDIADTLPTLTLVDSSGQPVAGMLHLNYDRPAHTATFSFDALPADRYHAVLSTPGIADFDYDFVYVPAGQRLALPAGQNFVFQSINLDPGATLDLSTSSVVLDYTDVRGDQDPAGMIQALLHNGYGSGDWSGTGLTTSAANGTGAIAYDSSVDLDLNQFAGRSIDATSILLKFTYAGDANLDGRVNGDDYFAIDSHIHFSSATGYADGDFNYDGHINGDDYYLIDSNINQQRAPLATPQTFEWAHPTLVGEAPILPAAASAIATNDKPNAEVDALLDSAV